MSKPNGVTAVEPSSGLPSGHPGFTPLARESTAQTAPRAAMADAGRSRLTTKKMAGDKARARTLARVQAVSEKLSTATEEVGSAINEATSAVHELEKTMQSIVVQTEE